MLAWPAPLQHDVLKISACRVDLAALAIRLRKLLVSGTASPRPLPVHSRREDNRPKHLKQRGIEDANRRQTCRS